MNNYVYYLDNLPILRQIPTASVPLIYIDPPFNTGKKQVRTQIQTVQSAHGDRVGFQGRTYATIKVGTKQYNDTFAFQDYYGQLEERLIEAQRVLADNGTLYFHIDYREVHYCKVMLDTIFGRECFLNEVIWAYDYGARTRTRWPAKHDNILVYVKDPANYVFNYDDLDRIPYMAPSLVGPEKAQRGKTPTDVWWHTIVPTNSKEKTGYPTQKPLGILKRIIRASSHPGDVVLDFYAGSGSTGYAARELGCHFILVDDNPEAIEVMERQFAGDLSVQFVGLDPLILQHANVD